MARLVLLRHGLSTWNVEGRLQGQTMDVPLTARGLEQAGQAADAISRLVPAGTPVWSSDQRRARQTAEIVAARLGSELHLSPLLREQGLGELEGRLTHELSPEPVPPGQHISEIRWGGGESVADVYARSAQFLHDLPPHLGDAVIVGHGDSLRILLAALAGRGHREVDYDVVLGNCVPVIAEIDGAA